MHPALRLYGLLALVACLFMFALVGIARAHDGYDYWCCTGDDCKPYYGTVETRPGGYYLPEFDQTIPYKDAKGVRQYAPEAGTRYDPPTRDTQAQYHICILPWEPGKIRCFYAKPGGV